MEHGLSIHKQKMRVYSVLLHISDSHLTIERVKYILIALSILGEC